MEQSLTQLLELQKARTKREKTAILKANAEDPVFVELVKFLCDNLKTTGVSTKKLQKAIKPQPGYESILTLLEYLLSHPTGDSQALSYIWGFLSNQTDDEAAIYKDIISKKFRIGVSAKTVNETINAGIPVFDVQLAFAYDKEVGNSGKRIIDTVSDELYVTQKLDGHRAITLVSDINGKMDIRTYSRKGQSYEGLSELHENTQQFIEAHMPYLRHLDFDLQQGLVLDGELLLDDPSEEDMAKLFQKTGKVLRTKGNKTGINHNIFDILPYEEFMAGKSKLTYADRRSGWLDPLSKGEFERIHIIPVLERIGKDKIPYWSQEATERGWEGVMLNTADGYYETKRNRGILKVKRMHTADLPIVGFNEAIDGKYKGTLKSINVEFDGHIVSVSSGFEDEIRQDIWDNQDDYLGKMVEIQYFEITQNQKGETSLRFPVFKCFRPDKGPEDYNVE